uniref:Uncharacterized protein n=1 Tax=Rhizophagus irregularis (strain DAOM 181602 / DAOM 197198 / MUCL 43194) TaxID=747089 RepID=U9UF54_RHIID
MGIAQNPTPNTWSDNDFKTMENTLQHCLSFIRFFLLNSHKKFANIKNYLNVNFIFGT